jgi:hypothetical protein
MAEWSKRDYLATAAALRKAYAAAVTENATEDDPLVIVRQTMENATFALASMFAKDNPAFNAALFLRNAGIALPMEEAHSGQA